MEKYNLCAYCPKRLDDFSSRSSFNCHVQACCEKRGTDELAKAIVGEGSMPSPHAASQEEDEGTCDRVHSINEQNQLSSGSLPKLVSKFVPVQHSRQPKLDYERKQSLKLPPASDGNAWAAIEELLVPALEEIQYMLASTESELMR